MGKRKLTSATWEALLEEYESWDPTAPDSPTIEELVSKHGISKQTFYYEMRKRQLPLKGRTTTREAPPPVDDGLSAILALLVERSIENARLKAILEGLGYDERTGKISPRDVARYGVIGLHGGSGPSQ